MTVRPASQPAADIPSPDGRVPLRQQRRARDRSPAVPRWAFLPAGVAFLLLTLPVLALLVRANWPAVPSAISSPAALNALVLSVQTGLAAVALCVLLGVPLSLILARSDGPATRLVRALTTLPLVLPPLVGGIALLYLLGRAGLIGGYLDLWFGITIPFTTVAVVLAQTFVALPFMVLTMEGALRTAGTRFESVAATLGAGRWTIFRRITIPLVLPGLASGTVLCLARAMGEFGATALFAGNAAGVTRTMPLAIYTYFHGSAADQETAIALSLLLVAVAITFLLLIRGWRPGGAA